MNNERCYFDVPGYAKRCNALSEKHCEGCSFYKTYYEAIEDQERAAELLRKNGLIPYQKGKIMTTRKITKRDENKEFFAELRAMDEQRMMEDTKQ